MRTIINWANIVGFNHPLIPYVLFCGCLLPLLIHVKICWCSILRQHLHNSFSFTMRKVKIDDTFCCSINLLSTNKILSHIFKIKGYKQKSSWGRNLSNITLIKLEVSFFKIFETIIVDQHNFIFYPSQYFDNWFSKRENKGSWFIF